VEYRLQVRADSPPWWAAIRCPQSAPRSLLAGADYCIPGSDETTSEVPALVGVKFVVIEFRMLRIYRTRLFGHHQEMLATR
jgi:hypothetical protein